MSIFHFTSRERIGIIALLIVSSLIVYFCSTIETTVQTNVAVLGTKTRKNYIHRNIFPKQFSSLKHEYHFFVFDPNTISLDDFIKMGFSEKQASVIIRYREKGGRFKTANDFAKIYSISQDIHKQIRPFIKIDTMAFVKVLKKPRFSSRRILTIEINGATEDELTKLPFIGCSRAHTIVVYREKLGGFYSIQQLMEVYGLTPAIVDSLKPLLTIDSSNHNHININSGTIAELKTHPYFNYFTAKKIVDYRKFKGEIASSAELLRYKILDTVTYRKILPYISTK